MMMARRADDDVWHLDKKVPISIIAALLMQFVAGLWFVSKLESRIVALEEHEQIQGQRDSQQDLATAEHARSLSARLDRIESKLDRLIEDRRR